MKTKEQEDRAVDWLLRLRELQTDGLSFEAALAQANKEADDAEGA